MQPWLYCPLDSLILQGTFPITKQTCRKSNRTVLKHVLAVTKHITFKRDCRASGSNAVRLSHVHGNAKKQQPYNAHLHLTTRTDQQTSASAVLRCWPPPELPAWAARRQEEFHALDRKYIHAPGGHDKTNARAFMITWKSARQAESCAAHSPEHSIHMPRKSVIA